MVSQANLTAGLKFKKHLATKRRFEYISTQRNPDKSKILSPLYVYAGWTV